MKAFHTKINKSLFDTREPSHVVPNSAFNSEHCAGVHFRPFVPAYKWYRGHGRIGTANLFQFVQGKVAFVPVFWPTSWSPFCWSDPVGFCRACFSALPEAMHANCSLSVVAKTELQCYALALKECSRVSVNGQCRAKGWDLV